MRHLRHHYWDALPINERSFAHEPSGYDSDPSTGRGRVGRGLPPIETGGTKPRNVSLFSEQVTGLAVRLPNWQYPVVVDVELGTLRFDNFGGNWGEQKELDLLLQAYAVERAKLEARQKGYACTETTLTDGSIKLQILEGA